MLPWLTAAAAVLVAVGSMWMTSRPVPSPVTRFAVTLPLTDALTGRSLQGLAPRVGLSPDGRTLVYDATRNGIG